MVYVSLEIPHSSLYNVVMVFIFWSVFIDICKQARNETALRFPVWRSSFILPLLPSDVGTQYGSTVPHRTTQYGECDYPLPLQSLLPHRR